MTELRFQDAFLKEAPQAELDVKLPEMIASDNGGAGGLAPKRGFDF